MEVLLATYHDMHRLYQQRSRGGLVMDDYVDCSPAVYLDAQDPLFLRACLIPYSWFVLLGFNMNRRALPGPLQLSTRQYEHVRRRGTQSMVQPDEEVEGAVDRITK